MGKVQQALLLWDPTVLPQFGADGEYGSETAGAVHQFKARELLVPEAEIIDDVGPRTVIRLDEIALAASSRRPRPSCSGPTCHGCSRTRGSGTNGSSPTRWRSGA